jgi:hypothetical protein
MQCNLTLFGRRVRCFDRPDRRRHAVILNLDEAAVFLGIDHTVEVWERHFGCPQRLDRGDGPGFAHEELTALRVALDTTFSIPAAVAVVRGTAWQRRAA